MITCPRCNGSGYTREGADVMRTVFNREYQAVVEVSTIRKGCGCELCQGLGQVADAVRIDYIRKQRRDETRTLS